MGKDFYMLKVGLCLALLTSGRVFADEGPKSSRNYPEAAVQDAMAREEFERKAAEELEEKSAKLRAEFENRRRDAEIKLNAFNSNIERLRLRQERTQQEIDALKVDTSEIDERLEALKSNSSNLEESVQKTSDTLEKMKSELTAKNSELDSKIESLQKAKSNSESSIYNKTLEIQRLKNQLAEAETRTKEAEAVRANLEADEMKTRTLWMQTKLDVADRNRRKDEAVIAAREAQKRSDKATADLRMAKSDLVKAEKDRLNAEKNTETLIAKYERDIINANKNKIALESERIRLESEINKLQDYAMRIKSSRDQSVDETQATATVVMKARLAVENQKSDLKNQSLVAEQALFQRDKAVAQARGLAAAGEAADLFVGAKRWISTTECKSFVKPDVNATSAGRFRLGRRVMARVTSPEWIEVISGSAPPSYVESRCGNFQD